jgi:1,4-dihydroxy-2-naphthoate octaprenyltransferase
LVSKGLYYLALLFDGIAIALGFWKINPAFAGMLLVYGLVSKAYSHPSIRIKKYAVTGWIITGLFQGLFTFVMCYVGVNNFDLTSALKPGVLIPGMLTSIMLWANYPMTQVYQHEEDSKRGDRTFSILLGIRGTFYFAAFFFSLTIAGFCAYFYAFSDPRYVLIFLAALSPVLLFFLIWFANVLKDERQADYKKTMWLNFISATCLTIFFIYLFLDTTQVIQALKAGF